MRVFDADAHIEESVACWAFLDPAFHTRRPIPVALPTDTTWKEHNAVWLIDRQVRQFAANPTTMERARKKQIGLGSQELTDVPARLTDMDRFGLAKQVIYPSLWLGCLAEDPDLEAALARSYNQFMSLQCGQSGGRLYYSAIVPFRRPEMAVAELRRVKELDGAASVFARGLEWDRPLNDPAFAPIFAEAERLDLPIAVHTGFGSPTIDRLFDGLTHLPDELPLFPPRGSALVGDPIVQFGFHSVVRGGLFEAYPRLRWAFLEAGAEWLVSAVRTLNHRTGRDYRPLFEGQVFASCEPYEDLPYLIRHLGEDWLVVASDMPHTDAFHHDRPAEEFAERGDVSEQFLQKLLWDNPSRLYGLPG